MRAGQRPGLLKRRGGGGKRAKTQKGLCFVGGYPVEHGWLKRNHRLKLTIFGSPLYFTNFKTRPERLLTWGFLLSGLVVWISRLDPRSMFPICCLKEHPQRRTVEHGDMAPT